MKNAHRKAIVAALAGAGLLAGNMAFGATNYTDYMEREALKKPKSQMNQKQNTRSTQKQGKQRNQ
jgi:uncharacterized protein YycO